MDGDNEPGETEKSFAGAAVVRYNSGDMRKVPFYFLTGLATHLQQLSLKTGLPTKSGTSFIYPFFVILVLNYPLQVMMRKHETPSEVLERRKHAAQSAQTHFATQSHNLAAEQVRTTHTPHFTLLLHIF